MPRPSSRQMRPLLSRRRLLVGRRSCLIDLLVARGSGRGAHHDRRTHLIEPDVVRLRTYLEDPYLVLGVAGVGHPLGAHGLVGVVARARNVEGLVYVAALGFLLEVAEAVATEEEVVVV